MALSGGQSSAEENNFSNGNSLFKFPSGGHKRKLFSAEVSKCEAMEAEDVEVEVASNRLQSKTTDSNVIVTSSEADLKRIRTFVFTDLEATGLRYSSVKSRIIEIGLVAVPTSEFLDLQKKLSSTDQIDKVSGRIVNKLVLCLNPGTTIMPHVSDLTGLDNYNLEAQPKMTQQTAKMLHLFLDNLPKPVCLVAHHGHGFDFQLLRAELLKLEADDLDVLVVDSLLALKFVLGEEEISKQAAEPKSSSDDANLDDFGSFQPLEPIPGINDIFTHREVFEGTQHPSATSTPIKLCAGISSITVPSDTPTSTRLKRPRLEQGEVGLPKPVIPNDIHSEKHNSNFGMLVVHNEELDDDDDDGRFDDPESTPDRVRPPPQVEPNAPVKVKKFADRLHTASALPSDAKTGSSHICRARKRLFVTTPPKSFSLVNLHEHLFGRPPTTSHTAEDDCLTLMRVCAAHGHAFVNYAQMNAVPFSSVDKMCSEIFTTKKNEEILYN